MNAQIEERHPHGQARTEVVADRILLITIDRTEKKNALSPKIMDELATALTRLDDDPDLFVGVLCFAGDHTTAGLDMPLFFGGEEREKPAVEQVDPFGLRRRLTKPLVAAVQGITYTAGIELALAADVVVTASDVRFCQMEPKRGLAPIGGATIRFIQRAGWGNAMYHLLRADEFDAAEAMRIGIVQEVVEPSTQTGRAIELAKEMLACSPPALQMTIENARLALSEGEAAAVAAVPAMSAAVQATEDFQEGIASFLERRSSNFKGR